MLNSSLTSAEVLANVYLGANPKLDPQVIIGYRSGRQIENYQTTIGDSPIIRTGTVIYAGVSIGHHLETGHYVIIREENRLGDDVNIWSHSVIDYGCQIGSHVLIHNHVYLAQYTVVEDEVFIGPGVVTTNDRYPVNKTDLIGPILKKGSKIGAHVTVLPGIVIGEHALIGAGSVVTRDVPPGVIVAGNPAKVLKSIQEVPFYQQRKS
ncbi:MAG: N-acetyltransferase [Candidatus Tectomicrobia bacterium]|nr:N-acetyltransferase [Candidatus Tectomicrobia bacterium]